MITEREREPENKNSKEKSKSEVFLGKTQERMLGGNKLQVSSGM